MSKPTKAQILAKYAQREPRRMVQLDSMDCPADSFGDLFSGETYELMRAPFVVRALIDTADAQQAVAQLRRIADLLERSPELLAPLGEPEPGDTPAQALVDALALVHGTADANTLPF